jgi:hypothetical protein
MLNISLPRFSGACIPSRSAHQRNLVRCWLAVLFCLQQLFFVPQAHAAAELPAVAGLLEKAFEADLSTYYDEKKSTAILFLADEHTFNPNEPRIGMIEKLFNAFRPTLLIVEGGNWPVAQSGEDAVRRYSELGFARYIAAKNQIRAQTFEPSTAEQVAVALKNHSARNVKLYWALRLVPQWRATSTPETLQAKMNTFLAPQNSQTNFGAAMPASTVPTNVAELDALIKSDFGADVDWRQADAHAGIAGRKFPQLLGPDKSINDMRNNALQISILDAMRAGNRVLVVTGVTHLSATLKPLMQQLEEFK